MGAAGSCVTSRPVEHTADHRPDGKKGTTAAVTGSPPAAATAVESHGRLWPEGPRTSRPKGKKWLQEASDLAARPLQKQSLQSDDAQALLRTRLERRDGGGWRHPPPAPSRRFPVFLSSTFTDTQVSFF